MTTAVPGSIRENVPDPAWPLAPLFDLEAVGPSDHFVQFYEDDAFLLKAVGTFISKAFGHSGAAIVIATEEHRQGLDQILAKHGLDVSALRASGKYVALDAAETLSRFMVDGSPDPDRFAEVVGSVVAKAGQSGGRVRAFGEMVALLWAEQNEGAAIALEKLWNELASTHRFALFCAYPLTGFCAESNGRAFAHICQAHSRVLPAEGYARAGSTVDERLRVITLLQQKAASLESEMAARDETARALARRERELSDFLENATEAIHKVGADGRILWANRAELELLGYDEKEYVGRHIAEFHADPEVIDNILHRLKRGEQLRDFEARLKHKDGSIRHVSINSSVYWEEDRFAHTKCFTRDITERKRAAEILERTVAERTAQLKETVAELEAFSYSISHDMRSPLRAMQGYAKALLEDYGPKLDPPAVVCLQRIQRAAHRLDLLVRDVLAYSKVAKGEIELRPIALGPLIEDIIHHRPELDSMKDSITVEPLHSVLGHEAYLTQCLTNLIENALKFMPPGRVPKVRIRSEEIDKNVRVSVTDNGIGIDPGHYDRIFRIFGRVHSEKVYAGTGIGLAVVSKAVVRMGGEVGFQSELGQGSRFWFTLPEASHAC